MVTRENLESDVGSDEEIKNKRNGMEGPPLTIRSLKRLSEI